MVVLDFLLGIATFIHVDPGRVFDLIVRPLYQVADAVAVFAMCQYGFHFVIVTHGYLWQ
jgi:hypothetical protein